MKTILSLAALCVSLSACGTVNRALLVRGTDSTGTNTVYKPAPAIVTGLDTASNVSSVLPPPYGTLGTGLASALAVALGAYARSQTQRANKNETALKSVITAIEVQPESGVKTTVKENVAAIANAVGIAQHLDDIVQEVSDSVAK